MTHSHECHASSKYSIKIISHHHVHKYFRMVCLERQRMLHHCMCAPPHSLHRLHLPILLLSANVCVYHIAYVYTHTPLLGDPPTSPEVHTKGVSVCMFTIIPTKKKVSNKIYQGLYTRVSTHVIMACFKGKDAETTNQTHACVRTFAWRLARQELTCVFV